jgi:hypothetical protein
VVEVQAPFVRIYIDLPRDVAQALNVLVAQQGGISKKQFVANLIADAAKKSQKGKK